MLRNSRILDDYLNEFSRYIDNMSSLIYFVWFSESSDCLFDSWYVMLY